MFRFRLLQNLSSSTKSWTKLNIRGMGEAFSPKEGTINKRKKYALFGGITMMYFGSHAILLWRRRSEYRSMNQLIPPISFEEFEEQYLLTGKVKSIVFHPNFQVCDGFLGDPATTPRPLSTSFKSLDDIRQSMLQNKSISGQMFSQKPDVRFHFSDGEQALELRIIEAQKKLDHPTEIHLEVNSFPSYRELAFITASVFFGACSVALLRL